MPFKFKLSKRLALMKAAITAGATLAPAGDRADPASPQAGNRSKLPCDVNTHCDNDLRVARRAPFHGALQGR
jgi:hypothetical protein